MPICALPQGWFWCNLASFRNRQIEFLFSDFNWMHGGLFYYDVNSYIFLLFYCYTCMWSIIINECWSKQDFSFNQMPPFSSLYVFSFSFLQLQKLNCSVAYMQHITFPSHTSASAVMDANSDSPGNFQKMRILYSSIIRRKMRVTLRQGHVKKVFAIAKMCKTTAKVTFVKFHGLFVTALAQTVQRIIWRIGGTVRTVS